ncbi:MAG: hypothetical protein J6K85_03555 [Clostridia bacterium]|nr:hypothetical protein [Clostridia bacterium]
MNENKIPKSEVMTLAIGEAIVGALVVGGFALAAAFGVAEFDHRVITGAVLGVAVIVLNYLFLVLSVNRAVNNYLALRGDREMSDEEAEKFAAENSMPIQNAIKTSYITRTVTMLAALVVAFVTKWFNPLATAIPLLAFRPLLSLGEIIRQKTEKAPNPEKFIKYDEKESDE